MSILLETTFGDLIIDLDVDGSPALCKNILKLVKARYYTNTLIYNVVPGKYCQMGDPRGDGTGGCSIYGLIDSSSSSSADGNGDVMSSRRRFLRGVGRAVSSNELGRRGVVVATEIGNVPDTIGSQFLITLGGDTMNVGLDCNDNDGGDNDDDHDHDDDRSDERRKRPRYVSLGKVVEDESGALSKIDRSYCDDDGRPYADVRIVRALVVHDPYDDPSGMDDLLIRRGVTVAANTTTATTTTTITTTTTTNDFDDDIARDEDDDLGDGHILAHSSPTYHRPPEEVVPVRIPADDATLFATAGWDDDAKDDDEENEDERLIRIELQERQEEEYRRRQDDSRAVVLEMLGDRPSAEIMAPEDVLFVCKLNPVTTDDDLELIFARFDPNARAEIIRDPDTGASLQYAFIEFTSKEACNEAYLKMNNALVDDRRIRVDFSQSVSKVWDRYNRRYRMGDRGGGIDRGFVDGGDGVVRGGRGRGRRGRGPGPGRGYGGRAGRQSLDGPCHRPRPEGWHREDHRTADIEHDGRGNRSSHHPPDDRYGQDHPVATALDERGEEGSVYDGFGRTARRSDRRDDGEIQNRHPHDNEDGRSRRWSRSRSRSRSRDAVKGERGRRSGSGSRRDNPGFSRRSRSRSVDCSSDGSRRRRKKHRSKHSRYKDRSRSRERRRTRKRGHHHRRHHRRRDDSSEEGEKDRHGDRRHRRCDESSQENDEKRHRRRGSDDVHRRRRSGSR